MDLFHPIGTKKPDPHGPLEALYRYNELREQLKERAAMLAACFLLPLILAAVLHLAW